MYIFIYAFIPVFIDQVQAIPEYLQAFNHSYVAITTRSTNHQDNHSPPAKRPTPNVKAVPKAASSSSDDDSDEDVAVPEPQPIKTSKQVQGKQIQSKLAPIFKPKDATSKNRKKVADVNDIPDALKPKKALKAPVSKPKPGSATEEEVQIVSTSQPAKKKKKDSAAVEALNAYEKTKDFRVQLRFGSSGRVENLKGLSDMVVDAFFDARNNRLPIELYTKDDGVYPEADVLDTIYGTSFSLAIAETVERDRFKILRERFDDDTEDVFFRAVVYFVGLRRNTAIAKPVNLCRVMSQVAYGIQVYAARPKMLRKAIRALLHHKAFIHSGSLVIDDKTFTWVISAMDKKKPYCAPPISQLISMAWMGHSKSLNTDKDKSSGGYDWAPSLFPNATFVKTPPGPGEPWPKEIPVPMMAFAATAVEFSLQEWDQGFKRPATLMDKNLKDTYLAHVKKLNEMGDNTRSLLLQHVYKAARNWVHDAVIEISSDSGEEEAVRTDEALGLYN
ncbi:hypothetical protein PENSPDRAFT_680348 [Peniophora sp. CONT]|nr:hypothetical protein PENSPDRAFT_680348 [Peniophora sp. CONT]